MHLFLVYFFCYWNHHHLSGFHFISAYDSHSCTIHNNHTSHIAQLNFLCLVKWVQPFRCSRGFFLPPSEFHIRTFFCKPRSIHSLAAIRYLFTFRIIQKQIIFLHFTKPNVCCIFHSIPLGFFQFLASIYTVCCVYFNCVLLYFFWFSLFMQFLLNHCHWCKKIMLKKELFNDCAQFNLMMEKWQMEEHFIIFFCTM